MSTATLPKGRTAPKGGPTPKQVKRNLAPTMMRRYHGRDHLPPTKGVWFEDQEHRLWHGHSRHAHPLRRKANRRTWVKLIRERRNSWIDEQRFGRLDKALDEVDLKPCERDVVEAVAEGATLLAPPQARRFRRKGKQ